MIKAGYGVGHANTLKNMKGSKMTTTPKKRQKRCFAVFRGRIRLMPGRKKRREIKNCNDHSRSGLAAKGNRGYWDCPWLAGC